MRLLVLAAGPNQPFYDAGYTYPKNLIEIAGRSLIEHIVEQLQPLMGLATQTIFAIQEQEDRQHYTGQVIKLLAPTATILHVGRETAGAACTALLAIDMINDDEPLVVVNGDQLIQADLVATVQGFVAKKWDGGIIVFDAVHPRWSYVRCSPEGLVTEAAEKRPISKLATAGFYHFRRGKMYVEAAMRMIKKEAHVGGRYFVSPVYNEMVLQQAKIGVAKIDSSAYISLANPANVKLYEETISHARARTL